MKTLLIASFVCLFASLPWTNDLQLAQQKAQEENKMILLNFSGSDWCGPCIMLKKKVFMVEEFISLANQKLVLMRADFPRMKKNQLPKTEIEKNEKLADRYNPDGKFPFTVLLNSEGEVIKAWDGFDGNERDFLMDLSKALNE